MAPAPRNAMRIAPVSGRAHFSFDQARIASSTKARQRPPAGGKPMVFVPHEDVHPGILEASDTTREDAGPGTAHFYTIKTLTADGADEAWYYPYAEGEFAPIRDMLTFGGERVS